MAFTDKQLADLSAKLSKDDVKSRSQAGRTFSYIEGWHAIAEANRIFGFDAWDRETVELRQLGEPREIDGKWRVGYLARVRITVSAGGDTKIVRDGCGYGSGIDKDVGQAHESALKEAETDAMKRALMTFGNPFGLALYDKTQENVDKGEPPRQERRPQPSQPPAQQQTPAGAEPPTEPWKKPARPAEIPIPKSGGKPDWKDWASMILHALSQAKDGAEASAWMRMNNPAMIALSSEAPKLWTRISDYARECGAEPNPMAA